MRTLIALGVYVSLVTGSFAGVPNGTVQEWKTIYEAGLSASRFQKYEEALNYFEQSWETSSTLDQRGASATHLGQTYRRLGRIKEARQWLERAKEQWTADSGRGYSLAVTDTHLSDLYRSIGDYAGAERLLREALVAAECDKELKTSVRTNLADLLREEGRSVEAQPLFLEAIRDNTISSRQRVAALVGLAELDRQAGNRDASIDRWNEVLEICRREKDENMEAIALRGLALSWIQSGTVSRAEPLLRRSLRIMEDNPETPPELLASTFSGMGELYRAENKLALAEGEWSRALQINRKAFGEAHPQVAWLLEMLSDVYSARGEFGLARDYATKASEMMSGSFGENSMAVAAALGNRALVEQRASDLDAAAKDYERAIGIARAHPGYQSLQDAMIQRYSVLLKTMHRSREAKALLSQRDIQPRSLELK